MQQHCGAISTIRYLMSATLLRWRNINQYSIRSTRTTTCLPGVSYTLLLGKYQSLLDKIHTNYQMFARRELPLGSSTSSTHGRREGVYSSSCMGGSRTIDHRPSRGCRVVGYMRARSSAHARSCYTLPSIDHSKTYTPRSTHES